MILPNFNWTSTPTLLTSINPITAITADINMPPQRRMSCTVGEEEIDFFEGEIRCFGVEEVDNLQVKVRRRN